MNFKLSKTLLNTSLGIMLTFGIAPGIALAQSGSPENGPQRQGPGGPPPQEAFDACASLLVDDACSVETPNGTLEGTCQQAPRDEELVCMPAR